MRALSGETGVVANYLTVTPDSDTGHGILTS